MATDMFMIYQINDAEKNREYRCRSYAYQIEHGFMITTDNYEISYCAKASQGLFPAKIRENMESLNPDKFKIRKFGVSDVIAITAAGKTAFYYVDKEALVKFNGFLAPKAEGSYLILIEGGYQIDGQTDSWTKRMCRSKDLYSLSVNRQKSKNRTLFFTTAEFWWRRRFTDLTVRL